MLPLSRRHFLALGGALGGALATGTPALAAPAGPLPWSRPEDDPVAERYHRVLHLHTRWVEQQWDPALGAYRADDFRFTAVLGNAVLLAVEDYDAELAGVSRMVLRARTLATIKRYAATNRLAGGTEWGRRLFWDSTFELYFVLAARLLWADLDDATRHDVQQIATGQAAYAARLGTADDPLSSGWTPNGVAGGWAGDTKLEEMGVYAQAIAPGLAWAPDPDPALRERFLLWFTNASALPVADRANPARVDGLPVRERSRAHNIHDTFIVENHGAAHPHYQAELWRTAGRVAIHFLAAGRPLPEVLTRQPNGRQLWDTLKLLAGDAGEPVMPTVSDRYHLYGRDVLPLAFLAQVQGDPDAARCEADLAVRLEPYLRHRPEYRLTKFSGEEKYEPEARAELAIAYLFHRRRGTPTPPRPPAEFFAGASGARDFGPAAGLIVQQTPHAFAAAVTKPDFTRFLWQPQHDNWLIDTRASAFLPAGLHAPTTVWSRTYQAERDGADATATVLGYGDDYAGLTTLPTGTVVYASSGVGVDEGALTLFNLEMPGMPGLTGLRTFTSESSRLTLSGSSGGGGDGGIDELAFPPRPARYVRMLGRRPATRYGYSMWTFSVLDSDGADLAVGARATASSSDVTYPFYNATDGNPETRWAVDRSERGRPDSWLAVDLGSTVTVAGVRLHWEAAYGAEYVVQTSTDAVAWSTVATVPQSYLLQGGWVDVDGRAGLVVRDTERPITVTATGVVAASGDAGPTTVEGYADRSVDLAAAAVRPVIVAPDGLRVSDADGYLSIFNLTTEPVVGARLTLPTSRRLYLGTQVVEPDGMSWTVSQPPGTARVEPPRFTVDGFAPVGTRFRVTDSHHVTVTAADDYAATVTLRSGTWSARIRVPAGRTRALTVPAGRPLTPTADHARGRTTFPTSPLPVGMTPPGRAVDGDARTSWRPGPTGRMVVDLAAVRTVTAIRLTWTGGRRRPVRLERSTDGLTYTPVARLPKPGRVAAAPVRTSARYVAVVIDGWQPGDAELTELAVFG